MFFVCKKQAGVDMSTLKIALAQMNFFINDFSGNANEICRVIADNTSADVIVFSEMALSGYSPMDLVDELGFLARQAVAMDEVLVASRATAALIVLGAVTENRGVGKPFHNSLVLIREGKIIGTYHKQLLPTYNIFDERRYFEPGSEAPPAIDVHGVRIGFLICEDGWNDLKKDYAVNPVRQLKDQEVDLMVSINASPSNIGKGKQREIQFSSIAARYAVPFVYVNQVGGNDQIVFDGASFVVHPDGGVVFRLPQFKEAIGVIGFQKRAGVAVFSDGSGTSLIKELAEIEKPDSDFYFQQIILGLRDYAHKTGFSSVVVGSSGGIDSALTLALARDALGAENVIAITMPSCYSSPSSISDSEKLCRNLGVTLIRHEIAPINDSFLGGFVAAFSDQPSRLTQENIQARIRGAILMEYSNHFGNLLLTTGNKSEISVGYFTLYGDSAGGLNLIGDLYKTEVFELARWMNQYHGTELIPQSIIDKEPSAELWAGQKDVDTLPPYAVLDEVLKWMIEGQQLRPDERVVAEQTSEKMKQSSPEVIEKISAMIRRSEFKRKQAAPIIRLRSRAFGHGRQIPVAAA